MSAMETHDDVVVVEVYWLLHVLATCLCIIIIIIITTTITTMTTMMMMTTTTMMMMIVTYHRDGTVRQFVGAARLRHQLQTTQSQHTDTGPISPSTDPISPGAWQGSNWSANS